MTPVSRWDVVLVLHNSAEELRTLWTGIPPELLARVCAIDNGSADDSYTIAKKLFARVIRSDNVGLARGNNLGLESTSAEYVLFVNPDVRITIDGLRTLESALQGEAAIIGPRLENSDGSAQPNGRGIPCLADQVRNRIMRARSSTYLWPNLGPAGQVPWILGAAIACKRATIVGLGGWPEDYFLYYEDTDLCLSAWERGVPVRLIEEVRWTHAWAKQSASWRTRAFWLHARSSITFFRRHPRLILGPPTGAPACQLHG
jgi:GT2 family glycosyltransferase